MVESCPCCGQIIKDAPLKVSLEFNTVICGDRALALTPKAAELVFVLQKRWPNTVSFNHLISQVWGNSNASNGTMRNLVYKTRMELEKIDYTIRLTQKRGYRLERLQMLVSK